MEDSLDRPATDEEIAEVERLLKATSKKTEIVPLPKPRPMPKTSTEVLALPVMPPLSPTSRKPESARAEPEGRGAVVLPFEPTKPVWMASAEAAARSTRGWAGRPGGFPEPRPATARCDEQAWVWGIGRDGD